MPEILVNAPNVPVGNVDSILNPVAPTNGTMVGGPPPWVARAMDLDTPAFYERSLPGLSKIIKSTKAEADKLTNALNWFRDCTLMNKCKLDDMSNSQYLVQQYDLRNKFSLNDAPPKFSNSPYAIVSAMGNFLWGNGRTMSVDIDVLALQFLKPSDLKGFAERVNAVGQPGQHNMTFAFPYDTAGTNVFMPYILGNITLQLDGVFTRNATGTWGFDGVVREQVPDLYDFNASTHRTKVNEDLTTIGRWMGERFHGTPYKIEINGEKHVKF